MATTVKTCGGCAVGGQDPHESLTPRALGNLHDVSEPQNITSPLLALPAMDVDRKRIEKAMHESVQTPDSYLNEIASHLIVAGGKRLRPVLAVPLPRSMEGSRPTMRFEAVSPANSSISGRSITTT